MTRKCDCSGACGPASPSLTRREFITLVGAGTAGALLGPHAQSAFELPADALARWKRELAEPDQPRRYLSSRHTDARMHLGGIGTGNFEVGADGQFTTWQLFNTLRDGHVPFHLGVKCGSAARLLQTVGGPEAPRIARIEMTGEYPFATLRFHDPEMPVALELTAFSPLAPLDSDLASVPLAVLLFKVTNPTGAPLTVALGAWLQNPIGDDATTPRTGDGHPDFGGNYLETFAAGAARGLVFRARPATESQLDQPVTVYAGGSLPRLAGTPTDRPNDLTIESLDKLPADLPALREPRHTVVWIEDAPSHLAEALLQAAHDAVQKGATLVLAGETQPLIADYAVTSGGRPLAEASTRPDILFDDFEQGYGKWRIEGDCFGPQPPAGTLANQQRVSGFLGRGLVNTYLEGDRTTGRAVSQPFKIERHFLRFLIGGGSHGNTQFRLVVGGKTVRHVAGRDNERLEPAAWDVREFAGQDAHLEIVDENTGPWGHINVDQIVQSDERGNRAVLALLEALLPARFAAVTPVAGRPDGGSPTVRFESLELRAEARRETTADGLELYVRPLGQGRVVLAAGPVLTAGQAAYRTPRQKAYATLCRLVGAQYQPGEGTPPKAPGFGTLALAAVAGDKTARGAFANMAEAWRVFAGSAHSESAAAPAPATTAFPTPPTPSGLTVVGAVTTQIDLPPGGEVEVPFLLTWHYPNKYSQAGEWMGCHYATRWPDAAAVLRDSAEHLAVWRVRTEQFRRAVYGGTLPYWLVDCLTANAAIIRHIGVVFRIANGDPYGWEGSNGCCQPTCTHVWGYEQTLARLFPDLEREMRRIDFRHQQRPDGGVNNRTEVPSPPRPTGEQPFADGHASCILKAYREALNSPDDAFLKEYWPNIKRAVDYLVNRDAASHGGQPAGYLEDDQWNTYDQILHGVTTFISTYYLAALRAGEEWARRVGDADTAARYHDLFTRGQQKQVELCWNGEYFEQRLADYLKKPGTVGPGCMSDQLIGQWWAHQLGLGYLLPRDKVVTALKSVFRYNWKSDLTGWPHAPRAFAGDRDKGLVIVTWPKGGRPPHVMLYSDEVWTGIEYQVAAHMVYEGLLEEGLAVAKAARDRYDGLPRAPIPRNPWNEIECGGHYARALASWSLLLALSGWEYDGPARTLRFTPRHQPAAFRSVFVGPEGWGVAWQSGAAGRQTVGFEVHEGRLRLRRLTVLPLEGRTVQQVAVVQGAGGASAQPAFTARGAEVEIAFPAEVEVAGGNRIEVTLA